MAFNKAKALESALKYLNQGKVAQAIGEYRQILRSDPNDQATLMTVGDLYARQNDMTNAIEYFERLARVYLNDGFNSKAIAIYKKIAKLAPNELAPLERLADLYVQQGVLSEARPLYLQIAEAYLKANRAPKAVEVLHRLLEVEPESPRVQMRLAELYNVLGQKKEAAQTYLNYAQRLLDRGEAAEAEKLAERASAVDESSPDALLLKAKCLVAQDKVPAAVATLEKHPEADAGGEVTNLIVDLDLKSGNVESAADRARNQLLRGSSHSVLLHRVADALIEGGQAEGALPLLTELRDPMIEAGQQDQYAKSLSNAVQQLPGRPEPLETLADYCRTTSDPFRLNTTLNQLVDVYSAAGDHARAETILTELIDRNKDDERLVEKLNQLRATGGKPAKPAAAVAPARPEPEPGPLDLGVHLASSTEAEPAPVLEETLDDETQQFIAQALTDVDLFSSYGLTQKATHLLETVLERAPRHTPTLERLLDFYLGAGNERRTAELASQLEQIYTQRGDTHNAERFSELRMRFQTAAGMTADELPVAPPPAPPAPQAAVPAEPLAAEAAPPPALQAAAKPTPQASLAEFEIAMVPVEEEHSDVSEPERVTAASASPAPAASVEEVDLSDEWEAMTANSGESASATKPVEEEEATAAPEFPIDAKAEFEVAPAAHEELDPIVELAAPEPVVKAQPEATAPVGEEFDFELVEETSSSKAAASKTTDDLINELVAELDDLEVPQAPAAVQAKTQPTPRARPAAPVASPPPVPAQKQPAVAASASNAQPAASPAPPTAVPEVTLETLNQLSEVFQEFRNELGGDDSDEDEDLETHYNLGIAYREMGLLDEAIGEFQKVAKAVQKGKPFAYAMNCSALLALCFSDKGEPKIAALWYQRALETPGLDHEAILALRYDLAMSLEQAGESSAALDSFRQVYAMNIDYRDVADRIATLQKR